MTDVSFTACQVSIAKTSTVAAVLELQLAQRSSERVPTSPAAASPLIKMGRCASFASSRAASLTASQIQVYVARACLPV
jgi:hypothetical protein